MPPKKNTKRAKAPSALDRRGKKKVSILTQEKIEYVDWKDVNLLRRFTSDRAKIRARRVTGNSAQQQRDVAMAIKMQGKWHCSHTKIESPLNAVDAEATVGNVMMIVDQENQGKQTLLNKPQRRHLKLKKLAKKIPLRSQQNESCTSCRRRWSRI